MTRMLGVIVVLVSFVTPASAAGPVSQTFAASPEKLWSITESVLKQQGWEIDKADRTGGWIATDSRRVEGEDYGVYAKGTRHRLMVRLRATSGKGTTVTVERSVFKRERILWVDNDEPVTTTDQSVEKALLAAIGKAL